MEALWLLLAIVALRSGAARLFACVLLAKVAFCYAIVWAATDEVKLLGYVTTALIDIWALALLHPAREWRWGQAVWALQVCALASQALFWTTYAFGWYWGEQAFLVGRTVFTLQMAAVAWPGGLDLVADYRRIRRARRAVRRRAAHPARSGGVDVLGRGDARGDPDRSA